MTALNNNKETSINPMIIMDKAIDMSTRLSGSQFPVSIFPDKIQRIIKEVHECHSFPTDYISAAIRMEYYEREIHGKYSRLVEQLEVPCQLG